MTKYELYGKLMNMYQNHCVKNTLVTTYVDNVIDVVYEYLKSKMNTSDVVLEDIRGILYENLEFKDDVDELLEPIIKDLKRLEMLEKENEELRKAVKSWNDSIPKLIHENVKLKDIISSLKEGEKDEM